MTKKEFLEVVGKLSEYKSTAEGAAKIVKNHYPKKTSKEYKITEKYYTDAKTSFNKILDESKACLALGKKIEISEEDDFQVKADIKKLVEYSNGVIDRTRIPVDIILASLITIFGALWKYYQEWNEERRKRLLAELEKSRWKSFDEI